MTAEDIREELSDEDVARLLNEAGPRPVVPDADLHAVREAVRAEWLQVTDQAKAEVPARYTPAQPASGRGVWLAAAAALLALGAAGLWLSRTAPFDGTGHVGAPIAVVAQVVGSASIIAPEIHELSANHTLATNQMLRTSASSTVALHWPDELRVRLAPATELRAVGPKVLELLAGSIYVDTGLHEQPPSRSAIEVPTPTAVVHDIGTQFLVSVAPTTDEVTVHVREGSTRVVPLQAASGDAAFSVVAGAGETATVEDGRPTVAPTDQDGDLWSWTLQAAAALDLDGLDLASAITLAARERGLRVEFATRDLEQDLRSETYHGPAVAADAALASVVGAAALEVERRRDILFVDERR